MNLKTSTDFKLKTLYYARNEALQLYKDVSVLYMHRIVVESKFQGQKNQSNWK